MVSAEQQSESLNIQLLVDSVPALIHTGTPDGYLDYFNKPWLEYFGVTLDQVAGWNWTAYIHAEDVEGIVSRWRACLATGEIFEYEARVLTANGEYRWVFHRKVPLRDANGNIVKWYGSSMDIHERKIAEEARWSGEERVRLVLENIDAQFVGTTVEGELDFVNEPVLDYFGKSLEQLNTRREQEAELRQIVYLVPQQVAVFGPGGERLYASRATLDYLGLSLEEWRRIPAGTFSASRFIHPDDRERVARAYSDSVRSGSGSAFDLEIRVQRADGSSRWHLTRFNPLRDEKGQVKRWYVASADIDERKRAEQKLEQENVALREEIDKTSMFEEIVGTSPTLKRVLSRISKVAPTDCTVLITGETGTGKELVARAVHRRSNRASRAFVSVNCAAVPRDLVASELFGHEKGSFTGATQQRLGRFELADGGTLFLDEVGELPPETQIALLRVLQEHEFERVGGTRSMRANVRIIAATNRDLQAAISDGSFRSDLFYRLHVFPIELPALRERKEDIRLLLEYFVDRCARKAGKKIATVDRKTLQLLESYSWPGNIRELQNIVERSVIVSDSERFSVDESWLSQKMQEGKVENQFCLLEKVTAQEKELLEAALRECQGRVFGPSGAAEKLGIARSTLESKIRAHKINKNRFRG